MSIDETRNVSEGSKKKSRRQVSVDFHVVRRRNPP